MENFRRFLAALSTAVAVGVVSIVLVLTWVLHFREGLAWDGGLAEFNWHPVLIVTGFIFLSGLGEWTEKQLRRLKWLRLFAERNASGFRNSTFIHKELLEGGRECAADKYAETFSRLVLRVNKCKNSKLLCALAFTPATAILNSLFFWRKASLLTFRDGAEALICRSGSDVFKTALTENKTLVRLGVYCPHTKTPE